MKVPRLVLFGNQYGLSFNRGSHFITITRDQKANYLLPFQFDISGRLRIRQRPEDFRQVYHFKYGDHNNKDMCNSRNK